MILTIDHDIETPFDTKLFVQHLSDGLAFFPAIAVWLCVVQEVDNFVILIKFIDEVNQVAEVLRHIREFVISLLT